MLFIYRNASARLWEKNLVCSSYYVLGTPSRSNVEGKVQNKYHNQLWAYIVLLLSIKKERT